MISFPDFVTKKVLWLIPIILTLDPAFCYPLGKSDVDANIDKEEKRYPNGTIVGKYSYKDNEGNPIDVKYYADDSSYGVELKSIKVISSSENPIQTFNQPLMENLLQGTDNTLGTAANFYNPTNIKYKTNEPFEILNKDPKSSPVKIDYKTNPDYEIYFQNELKAPKKCGKDKVRVYFDKEKRKTREAESLDETARFCSQF